MESRFGDKRLDQRLVQLKHELNEMRTVRLPQTLTKWSGLQAAYRFLNNDKVTHSGMIQIEHEETVRRVRASEAKVVLAVQDTTGFSFPGRKALQGLGVLEDNRTLGFFAHTTLAVSEDGVPMGLLHQQVWSRAVGSEPDPEAHKAIPIAEKESNKWLVGLYGALGVARQVITVCDREADVYELFQQARHHRADFVVRVVRNRRLEEASLLHQHLSQVSVAARETLTVQRQQNQSERQAQIELRYATVTLLAPKRPKSAQSIPLQPQTLQVVEIREVNAPADVKDPILWILLTTLPVATLEDAHRIARYYTYRWLIERFHFILKSGGCNFEDSQLQTVEALHRLLALCSGVAWSLLWLTYQARLTPQPP
jgi:hypothetical protein